MNFTLPSFVHFKYEVDEEKAEEFKIISFISMVNGCNHLGIPYGGEKNRNDKLVPLLVILFKVCSLD